MLSEKWISFELFADEPWDELEISLSTKRNETQFKYKLNVTKVHIGVMCTPETQAHLVLLSIPWYLRFFIYFFLSFYNLIYLSSWSCIHLFCTTLYTYITTNLQAFYKFTCTYIVKENKKRTKKNPFSCVCLDNLSRAFNETEVPPIHRKFVSSCFVDVNNFVGLHFFFLSIMFIYVL